jgi:hypothetical protein
MNPQFEVDVYIKLDRNALSKPTYKTKAGIPFECVELVRRYFMQTHGLTFPSVVDATNMFYRIHELTPLETGSAVVSLQTHIYPYVRNALYYLRPGTMLFWEPKPTEDLKYGHVALVVEADAEHVIIVQQNRTPPIQEYDTRELFNAINAFNSVYLGIKIVL